MLLRPMLRAEGVKGNKKSGIGNQSEYPVRKAGSVQVFNALVQQFIPSNSSPELRPTFLPPLTAGVLNPRMDAHD